MAQSILELQDLYNEALVRELIEKTRNCALVWTHLGGTQFQATQTTEEDPPVTWDFYLTKTQVGTMSYKYSLDVKKDAVTYITMINGPLPHTSRDSVVKDLYEVVEIVVLELDKKIKETVRLVQQLAGCEDA